MAAKRRRNTGIEQVVPVYRSSTELQEDSIDRQKKMVVPYAAKRPWKLLDPIEDEGVSGTEIEKRPGLQKLLAMVKAGEVDGIIVDDLSRLTRLDMIDLFWLLKPIRAAGVWIESISQGRFDYASMIGRMNIGLNTENKHAQAVETGRNTLTGYLRMARDLGMPPLPRTLFGYTRIEDMQAMPNRRGKRPGKWIVNDDAAAVVRQIFKWYVEGQAVAWIIKELLRRGVRSPSGNPLWRATVIRKMLANEAYLGLQCYGKTASGKFWRLEAGDVKPTEDSSRVEIKPREEWMFSADRYPAIIDRETFAASQARRAREQTGEFTDPSGKPVRRNTHSTGPSGDPSKYILSKLLVCGKCGAWLSGFAREQAKGKEEYMCMNYIKGGRGACVCCRVKELPTVKRLLGEIEGILTPERQQAFHALLRDRLEKDSTAHAIEAKRKEARSIERQLDHWRKLLGKVSDDMLSEVEEGIRVSRAALADLHEQIAALESSDLASDLDAALQEASKEMWSLRQALENDDRLQLREALHGIIKEVFVTPVEAEDEFGRKRFVPGGFEVVLRKGSGLALLSNFDPSCAASVEARYITFRVSA